jgi:hypothetical protein
MDLLKNVLFLRRRWRIWICSTVVLLAGVSQDRAYAPILLLGAYGQEILSEDQGWQTAVRATGLLSWRTLLAENASLAVYASSAVDRTLQDSNWYYDFHSVSFDLLLGRGATRFFLDGGVNGSVLGTLEGQAPYLRPDWTVAYEHDGDRLLRASYSGYYLYFPDTEEDTLSQQLTLGLAWDKSIQIRYGLDLHAGWESWTGTNRDDLLGSLEASADGLIGYFHDWSLNARAGLRLSEDAAESNLFLGVQGDWAWSPHRQISLETGIFLLEEIYYQAGGSPGIPKTLSAGAEMRCDWTPNDRLFLVAELAASRRFATDAVDEWGNVLSRVGLEFNFR